MIRITKRILLLFSLVNCVSEIACAAPMPIGIPDPSGTVPNAIMPSVPTANSQIAAFPYDPIEMPTPSWNDGSNQYYVNSSHPNCNDTANGGRGSPSTPRCTLRGLSGSSWSLSAAQENSCGR